MTRIIFFTTIISVMLSACGGGGGGANSAAGGGVNTINAVEYKLPTTVPSVPDQAGK